MHTQSNPQQPVRTAPTADLREAIAATNDDAALKTATATAKPPTAKKPEATRPRPQRRTPKPASAKKASQASKPGTAASDKTPAPTAAPGGPREGSTMWAVLQVLGSAKEPLSAKDIYAQIAERKLAPGLKGKTPDQTIAAKLAMSAKKGEYVKRAAPGKFQLLKERS